MSDTPAFDDIKGGRGKCPKCGKWVNNVALHETLCDGKKHELDKL